MAMKLTRTVFAVALVLLALVAPSFAADPSPSASSIGAVDVPAVFDGYSKTQKSNDELQAYSNKLMAKLQTVKDNSYLTDAEAEEFITLLDKSAPTPQDTARIKALEDLSASREKELTTLQVKSNLSDTEKARQKELQAMASASDERLAKENDESKKEFDAKKEEMSEAIRQDIVKAIETVAKQKNLTLVVDKVAVLYGGTDITQAVLDTLNKKK